MESFTEYKNSIIKKANKSEDEFRTHFITFLAVNAGLFLLNMMTSPVHPWFLYVLGGWSIGVVSHWADMYVSKKEINDIESNSMESLNELKYFHKLRRNFFLHTVSNASVALFLLMINMITSPVFLWSLIPAVAMAIGIASHWASYTNKLRRMDIEVDDTFIQPQKSSNEHLDRALKLKESTIKVINEVKGKFRGFADETLPVIDSYVETIKLLTEKEEDLEKALKEIDRDEIINEKEKLIIKKEASTSETLTAEYDKYIEEFNTQLRTVDKLAEERELLSLKVVSAINNLKQLNLELISIKSKTTIEDRSIIDNFEKKSKELSIYYKDLMDSYDEVYK